MSIDALLVVAYAFVIGLVVGGIGTAIFMTREPKVKV